MTDGTDAKHKLKMFCRLVLILTSTVLMVFVFVLLVRAYAARGLDDLQIWHRVELLQEFDRHQYSPSVTLKEYLEIETRLFDELENRVFAKTGALGQDTYNRYSKSSLSCPDRFSLNWNRSFEMIPSEIKGGILLIHGLTDSPYSMKSMAKVFYDNDYYVLVLRMPGHGTIPAALTSVSWRDWLAATKVGARHVRDEIGPDLPFLLAGYSNGGALSLLYTLSSLNDTALHCPDRLILLSPAIAISGSAGLAHWLELTSVLPYFEKAKWKSVGPEYDPFKYNSFPLNGAEQSHNLSIRIKKMLLQCYLDGSLSRMPPVMTFQSIIDSTVIGEATVSELYKRLSPNGHELVVFDINHNAFLQNFIKTPPIRSLLDAELLKRLSYSLTLVTNDRQDSEGVVARTKGEGSDSFTEVLLSQSWPQNVYSLSHVALPFERDDPLYGMEALNASYDHIQLGRVYLRGDKNALRISEKAMLRLRCNPFWDYVRSRLNELIQESAN